MDSVADCIIWPLERGETLSNHDWFPFHGHRFLGSRFVSAAVMEGRRADIGSAMILWSEAMRQDPAGTLPDDDLELAMLARFGSVDEWRAVRAGVLHGWVPVHVGCVETGDYITRLGHPGFMRSVVEQMYTRKRGRDGAREAARSAVRKSRIRKKMVELKIQKHIVEDDRAVALLAEFFANSDLYVTADNVRLAMVEVLGYSGNVAEFPRPNGGRGAGL